MLKKKRPLKKFPPCQECGADPGFTWHCDCGFSLCHQCMDKDLERVRCNGRTWVCPECKKEHILAKG
ncbi:hypothetical protein ACQZV8_03230 [Magnetococcales bacterium HHB-1]